MTKCFLSTYLFDIKNLDRWKLISCSFRVVKNVTEFAFFSLYFTICTYSVMNNLHKAANAGNLERVKLLVEQGADKDKGNSIGDTPLFRASCNGHLDVVQYLVEQGASLNKSNVHGYTPLIGTSCPEVARYLLEQGADRDKAGYRRWTPLHWAAQRGYLEITMLLLTYGADLNARNDDNELPIDMARDEEIKQAIRDEPRRRMDEAPGKRATEQGQYLNAVTASTSTEQEGEEEKAAAVANAKEEKDFSHSSWMEMDWQEAAKQGNLKRVKLLVEQGADKDKGDSGGNTPLMWASANGHLDVVQYLVEQGASLEKANNGGIIPLSCAASNGQLDVARYLLEQGADRNKASNSGWTPLHWAAECGQLETAMLLMSYGADLNARNKYGRLPIDVTTTEEIKQAIRDEPRRRMDEAPGKRAIEQDRHPSAATSISAQQQDDEEVGTVTKAEKETIFSLSCLNVDLDLHEAARQGKLERVRWLVERGADKDESDFYGTPPLYWASENGHYEVVRYLVGKGASLNRTTNGGATPLSSAASNGHVDVVRYLLEQGADREKVGDEGRTPLHSAAEFNYLETAMLLMSYGADLNARTNDGQLPIDLAYTEEMRQPIRDEPRRRIDHGYKRATEQDRHHHHHPNTATSSVTEVIEQKGDGKNVMHTIIPSCLHHQEAAIVSVAAAEEDTKIASEDEDSEPSDDEDDRY